MKLNVVVLEKSDAEGIKKRLDSLQNAKPEIPVQYALAPNFERETWNHQFPFVFLNNSKGEQCKRAYGVEDASLLISHIIEGRYDHLGI